MDMYIYNKISYNNIKLNTKVCINLCKTCDAGVINLKSVNNNFCQILSYAILN